jgi:tRNA 2-thiouridine synthesizing protein A
VSEASSIRKVDALGLKCPLPALYARRALDAAPPGGLVVVTADDPMARIDIPHLCQSEGHDLLGTEEQGSATLFRIRKAGGTP